MLVSPPHPSPQPPDASGVDTPLELKLVKQALAQLSQLMITSPADA